MPSLLSPWCILGGGRRAQCLLDICREGEQPREGVQLKNALEEAHVPSQPYLPLKY